MRKIEQNSRIKQADNRKPQMGESCYLGRTTKIAGGTDDI